MWKALYNQTFFPLRKRALRFRRKAYSESGGSEVEQALIPKASLSFFSAENAKRNLFYCWVLSQVPWKAPADRKMSCLDIGSKNFFYVSALYHFLAERSLDVSLTGIEVDTGRRYQDFYRRGDYAEYYVGSLNATLGKTNVFYQQADWLSFEPEFSSYDLITSFFPFLFDDLHEGWGLPRRYFNPLEYYKKCSETADSVLFFHQGEKERQESIGLIKKVHKGEIVYEGCFQENPWVTRKHPLHSILWSLK